MKEASDNIEREFKFEYPGTDEKVLEFVRPLMRDSWRLVKWAPRTILDIYFDVPERQLFMTGATFRLRKRRVNPGWTANFKPSADPKLEYLQRREVRTSVKIKEAVQFLTTGIPGLAASLAHDWIRSSTDGRLCRDRACGVIPVVQLVSCRRCYTVRPGDFEDQSSNFLNVIFEEVTAIDLSSTDVAAVLQSGFIDYSRPISSVRFNIAELEVDGRSMKMEDEALDMMLAVSGKLVASGVRPVTINKYQQAISLLESREILGTYAAQ